MMAKVIAATLQEDGCIQYAYGQDVLDPELIHIAEKWRDMAALKAAGLKAVPTGVEHGTVTGVSERRPYEITTLRRDVETDGRRAVVAYTDDWLEDANRRDFTFNALYADRDGTLYDPFDGRSDLAAGRVRFIGDADTRIAEDRLRILRFFRFHAICPRPGPEVRLARAARHWRRVPGREAVSRTGPVVLDRVRSGTGLLLDVRRPPRMRRPQGFSGPQAHLPAGSAAPGPGTAPAEQDRKL